MTTTIINYADLCAYVAQYASAMDNFVPEMLGSWGIPADVATAEDVAQARVELTDIVVADYFRNAGLLDNDPFVIDPSICTGQPEGASCWKMRGYN